MITAWRAALAQTGATSYWRRPVAANSIAGLLRDLSSIFDAAVRNGRLASNPCKRLERAYHRTHDDRRDDSAIRPDEILNPAQIRQLIEAAKPGMARTLFTLAAATGTREGELLGLRWQDVAFDGPCPYLKIIAACL